MKKRGKLRASSPLLLHGSANTRDLGGYRTTSGLTTRRHRFLRSDGLHHLDAHDQTYLLKYGVTAIIDLRSDMECQNFSYQFPNVRYTHYQMLDNVQSGNFQDNLPASMAEMYIKLLDKNQVTILNILRELLDADGCALFHCTTGKDRTGVIAMLLLKLAGVPDELVIRDYAVSEIYVKNLFERQRTEFQTMGIQIPEYVTRSLPESMRQTLEHLADKYGAVETYLSVIGLSKTEQAALKAKLLLK